MRRALPLLVAALLSAVASSAPAATLDRSASGDGVTVTASTPFTDLPPGGCVPYQIKIDNDRNSAGTWRIFFQATSTMQITGATYFARDLSVAPNASAVFNLLVPLPLAPATSATSLTVGVRGPGFNHPSSYNQFFGYIYSAPSATREPFTIIGSAVLGPAATGPLETFYKGTGREFYGSAMDASQLSSDWRAYAAVSHVILADTEWLELDPRQRKAISDYVAQGGALTLYTTADLATRIPQLQLPGADGKPGLYGFGTISVVATLAFPPDTSALVEEINHGAASPPATIDQAYADWGLAALVGKITVDTVFILGFVFIFGTLIGPVNLFVFARGRNRFRLFWTTPLISILASLALAIGILVTDGLNGSGRQFFVTYSLPADNREAVLQEQITRTAVLFSSRWHNDQGYLITPVSQHAINSFASPGYREYGSRSSLESSPDTYVQEGDDYSGAWFRSRSVVGQYLQLMRPSRSRLTVTNPEALASGEPPEVLSSYPQELDRVFLVDGKNQVWTCDHLAPGRQTACSPGTRVQLVDFWSDVTSAAGGKLKRELSRSLNRPGYFYATGTPPAGDTLPTLGAIRWRVAQGLYLGPWVSAAPVATTGESSPADTAAPAPGPAPSSNPANPGFHP